MALCPPEQKSEESTMQDSEHQPLHGTIRRWMNHAVNHEVEEVLLMEAVPGVTGGLLEDVSNCSKHKTDDKHHKTFFSVDKFNETCLPGDIVPRNLEKTKILEFSKAYIPLVVRINTVRTSHERPDEFHGGTHYAMRNYKGMNMGVSGSGWIYDVIGVRGVCKCHNCDQAGNKDPKKYWVICVFSVRHVVYDQTEAEDCMVTLYDHGKEKLEGDEIGLTTLQGARMKLAHTGGDVCILHCHTHDPELGRLLEDKIEEVRYANKLMKTNILSNEGGGDDETNMNLAVCISHPHGKMKYVSVGRYNGEEKREAPSNYGKELFDGHEWSLHKHESPTCPGSSGSLVLMLGRGGKGNMIALQRAGGVLLEQHSGSTAEPRVGETAGH